MLTVDWKFGQRFSSFEIFVTSSQRDYSEMALPDCDTKKITKRGHLKRVPIEHTSSFRKKHQMKRK
jgi:hypothetical protein